MAANFDFIADERLRAALQADYAELQSCIHSQAWKAALVMSGSIVEAVLVDHLITTGQKKPDPLHMEFAALIERCRAIGTLSPRTADLSSVIRLYRNLIHPGRLIRLNEAYTEDDANVANSLVSMITQEVSAKQEEITGLTAEQIAAKFFGDKTAFAIATHLLHDVRPDQLKRLLITILPERLIDDEPPLDGSISERENAISKLYRAAFDAAPVSVRRAAMKRYVAVLKEGTATIVQAYEDRFFVATDLHYLPATERPMVITHLLSRFSPGNIPSVYIISATQGITAFLRSPEFTTYVDALVHIVVYSDDSNLAAKANALLVDEFYEHTPSDAEKSFRRAVDRWIPFLDEKKLKEKAAAVQAISVKLSLNDDIPF
jgi:hypothetical protein